MDHQIDPELAEMLPLLGEVDLTDIPAVRRRAAEGTALLLADLDTTGLEIDDRRLERPDGPPVPVRVYRPAGAPGPRPGLLHLHGGGFVMGDLDSEHGLAVELTSRLGITVVSVDYRLAPEHPYPAAFDDCYHALEWMARQAGELGVDPARLGISGQSAGGTLAAAVALAARDRGGPELRFQLLSIPGLDDRPRTWSMRTYDDTPVWTNDRSRRCWELYLADVEGQVPPYAAPARAEDLSGLPPTYVAVMQYDPLRDNGLEYATRLLQAGGLVELHCFPGTFHGSGMLTSASVSRRQRAELVEVLRRGLACG